MKSVLYFLLLLLALSIQEVRAQVFWKHVTSDAWLNPETQKVDSFTCFTAVSCYKDNCTAAAIRFIDGNVGRPNGIFFYHSDDGGLSWVEKVHSMPDLTSITNWGIRGIQQIDSVNAVAYGQEGVIVRTTDGGVSWFRIDSPVKKDIWDLHFSDPMTGVLLHMADSNLFITSDGGSTWHLRLPGGYVACHSSGNGKYSFFQYGRGPIYTTSDNFNTIDSTKPIFDSLSDPRYEHRFGKCFFGKDDVVFAVGSFRDKDTIPNVDKGLVIRSTDAGKSWEKPWVFSFPHIVGITKLSSVDRDTIFGGGGDDSHYIYSYDRGKTWHMDSIITDTNYVSARCYGMQLSADGHPIGIFGIPGFLTNSIIVRGEYLPAKVEVIERIQYNTYFYPNPTHGIVNIESIDRSKAPVSVIDIFGREVVKAGRLSSEGKLMIDLSDLPKGVYNVVFNYRGRKFIAGKVAVVQ